MGVPKFYRWISERYPCLSETVKEFQIPEFDNLYLDMNGIVHVCSHPDDGNAHFRITEEKIFSDIFHYLEFLFRIIKPQKVFYMAVDGVAPRAKMNQQRGRRFRSAREAEELEKKAREAGETLPTEKRFDSNCITPGTPFMVRLQEQLKYFVVNKLSSDPLWQGVQVHLSGHETPGEGEHKIMDFIRYQRSQPNYDPNTRHCLYGLDADLMMLGLTSHEPHFSLLREEVRFGGSKDKNRRPATPEETTFHLLHLSLFREYLDFEFSPLKDKQMDFPYDLERVIDDWVLLGFLVGNDFIPHLPNLHIQHDALPSLWKTYMNVLPSCGGYLNEGGKLNLERFEKFMTALTEFDIEKFSDTYTDLKWLEGKIGGKAINEEAAKAAEQIKEDALKLSNNFGALIDDGGSKQSNVKKESGTMFAMDNDEEDGDTFDEEFRLHKNYYYMSKMEYEKVTEEVLQEQAECYVRGLQWILLYYYEGTPSWSWYYPHHYAPYISDVKNFKNMRMEFDISFPFLPFQQLMAVLPALSKELLPEPYQSLMTMDNSPIIDFYPVNFQTDLNGKQQDWEAVVLIPFIDEKRLLDAMRTVESRLTAEEKSRNTHGPSLCYDYSIECESSYPSALPGAFPDIAANRTQLTKIDMFKYRLPSDTLMKGLLDNVLLDVYYPGFPTLKHIPHKARLKKDGVKVFQMNSRGENMVLQVLEPEAEPKLESFANDVLGKNLFVNWPHMIEAKVISVSDRETRYVFHEQLKDGKAGKTGKSQIIKEAMRPDEGTLWGREVHAIADRYHDRLGIEVGSTHVLLKALPMTGRKYTCGSHGRITLEKQFGTHPVAYLHQTAIKDIAVHDSSFCQFKTLSELFPPKQSIFMLGWPHYGCQGEVVDTEEGQSPRVRINVSIPQEPNLDVIENRQEYLEQQFFPGYEIAKLCGISSHFLSRITGSIMIKRGSPDSGAEHSGMINIGLNLKFTKRNEETPGYTKLDRGGGWAYSMKTKEVVNSYIKQFPKIWDSILSRGNNQNDMFYESELFPDGGEVKVKTMQEFVKSLPCNSIKTMKAGAEILDEGVIKAIEEEVRSLDEINKKKQRRVKMQVKPHLLYRPITGQGLIVPDSTVRFQLFDRVTNVRQGFPVPFGLRGTVIGIHEAEKEVDTVYDIIFDEEFQGGIKIRGSSAGGYRMPKTSILNLSHGERQNDKKPKAAVAVQSTEKGRWRSGANHDGFNDSYHNRNDNRYSSYNDNRYDSRNISKNDKQFQNSRTSTDWRSQESKRDQFSGEWQSGNNRQGHRQQNSANDRSRTQDSREQRFNNSWSDQRQNNTENWREQQQPWRDTRPNSGHDNRAGKGKVYMQQQDSPKIDVTSQQSFDEGPSAASPKFVMPKVNNKATPTQKQGSKLPSGKEKSESHNTEFSNIWKELQSTSDNTSESTEGKDFVVNSDSKELIQGTSLQVAAAALEKLPVPTGPSSVINNSENSASGQLTVENLFNQANKTLMAAENEQFSAMMKSLQLSQEKTEDGAIVISSKGKSPNVEVEDGTAALKQMLHIGSPEHSEASSKEQTLAEPPKTYGRQVSVQELFDVAKQPPPQKSEQKTQEDKKPSAPPSQQKVSQPGVYLPPQKKAPPQPHGVVPPYPPPLQLAPLAPFSQGPPPPGNYRQQRPWHQQHGFPGQPPRGQQMRGHPPHMATAPLLQGKPGVRNPVMELLEWCKATRQLEPKYDFFHKSGAYSCVVTLAAGPRFQGSTTRTKEEAAESAAAMALLNLGVLPHPGMPPMTSPRGFPGVPQSAPQPQISSPNSAFKPVSPKEYGQPQNNNPGGYTQQRGKHSQSVNQNQENRYHRQGSNQYQDNRQQGGYHGKQGYNQPGKRQYSAIQKTDDRDVAPKSETSDKNDGKPKSNPFVPMQVTRQQRTPGKRKESESLSDTDKNGADNTETVSAPQTDVARSLFDQKHREQQQTELLVDLSEPKQTTPPKQKPPTHHQGSGGKRKSRMAANFRFGGGS